MDINENILQAIQIVAESEINKVSFDKTVVCEIIDDTYHEEGKYFVKENETKFFAYSESTKYRVGQRVYVLIPGGKYDSLQKTILSRYTAEDSQTPITYIPPFDQLVILYDKNLVPFLTGDKEYVGLKINVDNINFQEKIVADEDTPSFDSRFCTSLGLVCEFKCLLDRYNIENGEYGLRIELWDKSAIKSDNGTINAPKDTKIKTLIYSSKNIFGNPFSLTSFIKQEAKLNIQNVDFPIRHIRVIFYEDNNFKEYGHDEKIKISNDLGYNIFVRNIQLYYANDVSLMKNHTFQIYSESMTYSIEGEQNLKNIYARWYNVDKNNKFIGYDETLDYSIDWFYSADGEWKKYDFLEQKVSLLESDKDIYSSVNILLRKNKKREYIKAVLSEKKGKEITTYESNILTFENIDISEDPLAIDQVAALKIELGKNANTSYPLYNIDNTLENPSQAYLERELIANIQCLSLNVTPEEFLENASFEWQIPEIGSMLYYNETFLNKKGFEKIVDDSTKSNIVRFKFTNKIKDKNNKGYKFYHQIRPVYSRNFINNSITCIAIYNSIEYRAQIHFDFSSFGMNNSGYYLTIVPYTGRIENNDKGETKTGFINGKDFKLEVLLFDADQKQVNLDNEKHIIWTLPDGTNVPEKDKYNNILTVNQYYNCSNIYKVKVSFMDLDRKSSITLSCEYGLPWSKQENYCGITPTTIIYDSGGVNPKYYRGKLSIFDINNSEEIPVNWDIKFYPDETEKNYLPELNSSKDKLLAQRIYIYNLKTKISLIASKNKEIIWEQPIIINQNTHSSKVLNEWDGSLQINEKENYALSAMFGAGRKNPNGDTFDGILMGDLKNAQGDKNNIGLYGYNEGAQSFGFNIDGTAFLGKSNGGRIEFDGNYGLIKSAKWNGKVDRENNTITSGTTGMAIDLDSGHLDAFNFMLSAGNLILNSNPKKGDSNDYYFRVGENDNMISLSADNKLDIHSNKFTLEAKDSTNLDNYLGLFSVDQTQKVEINNSGKRNDWRIIAGKTLGITKDGTMYASNVSLIGKIEADNGRIGNWLIKDGYLEGINGNNHTYIAPPGAKGEYILSAGSGEDQSKHPFSIKADGSLYAHNNVDIEGKITATSGRIGNWSINNNYLVGSNKENYTYIAAPGTLNDYVFSSGSGNNIEKHNFWIKADGSFKATEGTLGGWTVKNNILQARQRATYKEEEQEYLCWVDKNGDSYYAKKERASNTYNSLYSRIKKEYLKVYINNILYQVYADDKQQKLYYIKDKQFVLFTNELVGFKDVDGNQEDKEKQKKMSESLYPQYWYTYIAPPGTPGLMASHVIASGNNMPKYSPFQVLADGSLIATKGRIGGWSLNNSALYAEAKGGSMYLAAPSDVVTNPVINVSARDGSGSYFAVDSRGNMSAKNAVIEGEVVASKFTMSDKDGTYNFDPKLVYVPSTQQKLITGIDTKYYTYGTRIGSTEARTVPVKLNGKETKYYVDIPILTVNADGSKVPMAITTNDVSTLTPAAIRVIGY